MKISRVSKLAEFSSHAASDVDSRLRKAAKIERLLRDCQKSEFRGRMLEVGVGSGQISQYFADKFRGGLLVDGVDIVDQRVVSDGFTFQTYDGHRLPFADSAFDLILSNHVIEHVGSRGNQRTHLSELARVLRAEGVIYLAAPSKWQFVEPHFGLVALSWIPRCMRDGYVRLLRKGEKYDCNPMGHAELEQMARDSGLQPRNINAEALRALCEEKGSGVAGWLSRIPITWLALGYRMSPTMVYLLTRRAAQA